MAIAATFEVEKREKLGSAECRRLRKRGFCPGNLYGGDGGPVAFSVSQEHIRGLLNLGTRVVDFSFGGSSEKALVRELQWDTFTTHVTHIDLIRVDAKQRVKVEVSLEAKGISPGVVGGGSLVQALRRLEIDCLALEIPEAIQIPINDLEVGDSVTIADLNLPADIIVDLPATTTILQVIAASDEEEIIEDDGRGPIEPELIGKGKDSDDEDS